MLLSAFFIVVPIFVLIGLGYGVARTSLVSASAGAGLSEFVFVLAIPALLFRTVAGSKFPDLNPAPYWIAYFVGLATCWVLASFVAGRMGRSAREAALIGFSAAQSNTVLVGIPLILGTLGEAGTVPIILLLVIHSPITMTAVALLIARDEAGKGAGLKLLRAILTNPILLSIGIGLLWRQLGIPISEVMRSVLKYLGDTAAPCALIAMGMSMTQASLSGNKRLIGVIAALKLVLHPVLVYVFAVRIFQLPPAFAGAAILFAACPTGINAFLLAERYRSGESVTSGAITLTTLLAIFTLTIAVSVAMGLK